MRYLVFYLFVLTNSISLAQSTSNLQISFFPTYNNTPLNLNDSSDKISEKEDIQIETLKFYISKVELYEANKLVFSEKNSFHLIDAADSNSFSIDLEFPGEIVFSDIKFNLGIDSLTNVSGAFGGDLDPTNGMYWTWQSGYINFKLEGISDLCPARNNHFQFHIGGYQAPFNTLQKVDLKILSTKKITIDIAIDQLLAQINLNETYQIMSPNHQAVELSELIATIFSTSK